MSTTTMDKTTKNNACTIFSAGSYYGQCDILHKSSQADYIIAADAGYKNCELAGLAPDLIIGDFDSMEEPHQAQSEILRVPVEKDDTDTLLAIRKGLEAGCTEFHLYGATGGSRLDHTIANLQGLAFIAEHGARGYIYDDKFVFTMIKDSDIVINRTKEWGLISVFCWGKAAEGVCIDGAQYPLDNGELSASFPLGVSNHFGSDNKVRISVADGYLLIAWELE